MVIGKSFSDNFQLGLLSECWIVCIGLDWGLIMCFLSNVGITETIIFCFSEVVGDVRLSKG